MEDSREDTDDLSPGEIEHGFLSEIEAGVAPIVWARLGEDMRSLEPPTEPLELDLAPVGPAIDATASWLAASGVANFVGGLLASMALPESIVTDPGTFERLVGLYTSYGPAILIARDLRDLFRNFDDELRRVWNTALKGLIRADIAADQAGKTRDAPEPSDDRDEDDEMADSRSRVELAYGSRPVEPDADIQFAQVRIASITEDGKFLRELAQPMLVFEFYGPGLRWCAYTVVNDAEQSSLEVFDWGQYTVSDVIMWEVNWFSYAGDTCFEAILNEDSKGNISEVRAASPFDALPAGGQVPMEHYAGDPSICLCAQCSPDSPFMEFRHGYSNPMYRKALRAYPKTPESWRRLLSRYPH